MDLEKMCRTCLCTGEVMLPLFDEIEELMEMGFCTAVNALETFTFVSIHYKDFLPDHICVNCLNELQRAYSFKLKCEKSEMLLNQLKDVKVNLIKLEEIPNRHEFESDENNFKLSTVKKEPEENFHLYDYEDSVIKYDEIKSELEFGEMSPGYHTTFKNEPELNIEDIECVSNELKYPSCENEFKLVDMFRGGTITDHIDVSLCKQSNEEFDCSEFQHSVKQVNYLNEITHKKPSNLSEDLKTQTENLQSTEKYCQHCSQNFPHLEMLKLHVCPRILLNRTDFNEETEYTEQNTNKNHRERKMIKKSTDLKSKYQCSVCSKVFKFKHGLATHMRSHTGETPFKCKFCSEQFRLGTLLRVHMENKHINELPNVKPKYQCSDCLKNFVSGVDLVKHMPVHTGEKPFQCEWCSKKFRFKASMVTHIQIRHAEKLTNKKPKHQCNVCSKIFSRSNILIAHMSIHSGDTSSKCQFCSEQFRHESELQVHMEMKHSM